MLGVSYSKLRSCVHLLTVHMWHQIDISRAVDRTNELILADILRLVDVELTLTQLIFA